MSFNPRQVVGDYESRTIVGEILSSRVEDFDMTVGEQSTPAHSGSDSATLRISLEHMDTVLAVSALSQRPNGQIQLGKADSENVIHMRIPARSISRYFSRLQDGKGSEKTAPVLSRMANDPVVERLSKALAAVETGREEFSGVYADAVRLAIVTRMLSARFEPEVEGSTARRTTAALPKWRLKRVVEYVNSHLADAITLSDMAAVAGLSRIHFAAQFLVATGIRPHEFVLRCRVENAQEMLKDSNESLVQIALSVGFQTQAHFTVVFKRLAGETPHRWRCANCQVN